MNAIIRPARPGEATILTELALRSKASWGYPPAMMHAFTAELTLSDAQVREAVVIDVDGSPAAFYSLQHATRERAELGHLFVEPRYQRLGLGRLMMDDALQRAATGGYRVLEIQGDPNAAGFYERVGARRTGERESHSIPGRMLPLFEVTTCNPRAK